MATLGLRALMRTGWSTAACALDSGLVGRNPRPRRIAQLLRAPSSFHLRSRLTSFKRCWVASARLPLALSAVARSNRALMIERVAATWRSSSHRAERFGLPAEIDRRLPHALTAASLRFDSGTMASVCLACSMAPVAT